MSWFIPFSRWQTLRFFGSFSLIEILTREVRGDVCVVAPKPIVSVIVDIAIGWFRQSRTWDWKQIYIFLLLEICFKFNMDIIEFFLNRTGFQRIQGN